MNVSEQIVEALAAVGVRHVFGVTGRALHHFVRAVLDHPRMEWIGVRHEEHAAFAACAQGQLSGTIGVCAASAGSGSLHLIDGLYNAKRERAPVLAITGQVEQRFLGTGFFQETDQSNIFEAICAYQAVIHQAGEAPRLVQRAIQTALAQRAVSRIELPVGVGAQEAAGERFLHPLFRSKATLAPHSGAVAAAADRLNGAEKITILAGAGCRGARKEVIELAECLRAPLVYTFRSADVFGHQTPNLVGQTGLLGDPSAYQAIMKSDLFLMLGTDFPYSEFLPPDTPTIQVDIRLENIGNRTAVDIGVHGDVKATIEQLLPRLEKPRDDTFLNYHLDRFHKTVQWRDKKASPGRNGALLHPQTVAHLVNKHAADDALFTLDTGTTVIWGARYLSFYGERRLLGSFNHGARGVALPAALGAQLLYPGRETWVLAGDAGFGMSMQCLITAASEQLPLKIIIFNNEALGMMKLKMLKAGQAPNLEASQFRNPDFAEYALVCGGEGIRVEAPGEVEAAILQAKEARGPFVVDARVSSGELPIPPNLSVEKAIKFAAAKIKEGKRALQGEERHWQNMLEELKAFLD